LDIIAGSTAQEEAPQFDQNIKYKGRSYEMTTTITLLTSYPGRFVSTFAIHIPSVQVGALGERMVARCNRQIPDSSAP